MNSLPCHRSRPVQSFLNGVQECPIPVHFQDTPATLDRVVFAVIGRIVDQANRQLVTIREFDHPLDELRAIAGHFRPVVQIDDQLPDMRANLLSILPPKIQAIDNEIRRFTCRAKRNGQQRGCHFQDTEGNQLCLDFRVVIVSLRFFWPRDLPPRDNSPIFTCALLSMEIRRESSRWSDS